ncbi:hypothetical protein [Rubinisphaera margarita]|uniref:hypothetical protein n=1 Tax=Rubinisphaera margarita TaxID=2909586 RepID=UPI001EE9A0AD|nr:hypothetical protein [Rubinisphaera margarita]MCG6158118.1 hypothetical protein [Rubinisphaera margarita]
MDIWLMIDRRPTWKLSPHLLSALLVLVVGALQVGTVEAQANRYSGGLFEPLTNTYFHLQYEGGDDWAQGTQQAQFGATRYDEALNGNGLWLNYGQFGFDHNGHHSLNAGVVRRFWVGGGIIGLGGHYDLTRSAYENDFQKIAVTGEWFSSDNNWIVRSEGNFAVGPDSFVIQDFGTTTGNIFFAGNSLMAAQSAGQLREEGMSGLEYELARALGNYAAEGYLGGYHYLGQAGGDANGIKGGVRGFISQGLFANLEVREDNVFGTSLYGGLTMFLGGPSRSQTHTLADQMIMPVQRHDQALINTVDTRVVLPDLALTQGGNTLSFTHINNVNTGDGGNAGTYENPYTSLAAANGSSADIVYVHSGTTYTNDGYEMSDGQRFLGEGGGNQHQLMTDQFGLILLPEANGTGGARPIIRGGTTPILVARNSEISNFDIEQASRTLLFNNVAGNVDVNRLTGSGSIHINGGSGDYIFSDVHIVNSSNGGLFIDGGSANVTFDGLYGGSSLSVLDGYAVAIQGNHSGDIFFPNSSAITATNAQGFSFTNGLSGTYVFNGVNNIQSSSGNAINLANAGGQYYFSPDTSITSSGDAAASLNLAGVNDIGFAYGGTILNNNGHAIQVSGGTGNNLWVAFGSSQEDAIQDNADGISITDTEADVAINADTELTGSNGIYIGNSNGTFSFADTDIDLSSGNSAAMRIDGGSSTVNFREHSSIINGLDRTALRVENGHTGTLNMEGTVASAAGNGLEFDNADGTYNFTGTTNLNGVTRGIDIANGSAGTFAFSENSAIANTDNEAVRMNLANADNFDFTYSGRIWNSTGRAISISGGPGTGQSVLFNSTEDDAIQDSGEGIRIVDTDADVNIQADTELTGSNGVMISNSDGTYTFADTDINLSSSANAPLSISGGSSTVNFGTDSSITNDQNRTVVSVGNGHSGTLTVDGSITSTAGNGLSFSNADGTYNFNGTTSLNGGSQGMRISNGSSGTFAFSENTSIVNPTGPAVAMDLTGADGFDFTYSGTIQNSTGIAVDITGGPGTGQSVLFNSTAANAIQDSGTGIWITNTNADVNIQSETELTGSNGIVLSNSNGTYTFADTDINLSSGTGALLAINGGSSTVNFGANSSITNDQNRVLVQVNGGHTGTLNMDGVLMSTAGNGMIFSDADGTYHFNGMTSLDGTSGGIDVSGGSAGTFVFSEDTSIANTTGGAIVLDLTGADGFDFTYSGTLQNSTGRAISVTGTPGAGQSVLFDSTASNAIQDSGEGIFISGTNANVNIQSEAQLTGSSGVVINNATGDYTFANTDLNLSSGAIAPLVINGGSGNVLFGTDSSITNDQDRIALQVQGGHTGSLTMNGTISSTDGAGLSFDNADGTYTFNGMTALAGTDRGIQVNNGSAGTFAFSQNTSISGTTNEAIQLDLANADNLAFTYSGTIQNSTGRAIDISGSSTGQSVLFNSTTDDAIQDSGDGISIANTDTNVNIQSDTELTGSSGVMITDSTGTYTFADTDINLSSGTDPSLSIDGGSSNVNFGANSSITNDQNRTVVSVENGHTGTVTMEGTISSTAGDGIVFDNADGTYNFNGTSSLNGTTRGIDVANGSAGTFTFSETTSIANTTDEAIRMDLANADNLDFTYSGTIQNSIGRAIDISGSSTGQSVLFNSTTGDAIQDSGDGISIANTGTDVTIQSDTELFGSSGVMITNSTGTYTFADTDINLSSGTSPALSIDGGSSNVNFGANSSITNDQNRSVVAVENGHTGTLTMDGTISATAGDGFVFDNADGTYNFNGTTDLSGTTRGIDVANGSAGTFAFSETTSIANTTDEAIRMDLANADNLDFTYSGTIQNSTGRAIDISGSSTGQSVLFNSTATDAIQDSGDGISIANTGTDVTIQSDTELIGSSGVMITDSTGTYTFADTDVNLSTGSNPALSIDGGSSNVNFGANSSITNGQNRAVVSVENGHTGTLTMDGTITSTAGDNLVFDNADGTYNFNGTTTVNGANRGIQISNGSEGTFTFSEDTSITNVNNIAIQMDLTGTNTFDFTYSGRIENSLARMIDINGGSAGQSIVFNSVAADALQDTGDGIWITNTAADVELLADTELTGNIGLFLEQADGTYTFADTDITDLNPGPFGNSALWIRGGSADVNFGTDSSITTDVGGNLVMVEQGHSGTLNMNGNLASTVGGGLVFNNADGTYNFNGTTTLNGTDRGIQVVNSSEGTFVFSEDTSISNTTNDAIEMTLVGVNTFGFTYSGTIQNSTGRAIDIIGGPAPGQSILFNSTANNAIQDSGEGISIANTSANVNIQADTELTGSSGVTITASDGTYTFADTDINLSSGTDPSLSISGGSSDVNFGANSSITNDQNRAVVSVENGHTGTLTMDGTIASTAGDGLDFNNAEGTYNFNGTTMLDGTTRGIRLDNGSAGTFTFSETTSIANTTNDAIELNLTGADNLDFTYSGTIQNSTGHAIDISGSGTGQSVLFDSMATDAIQDSGAGISIVDTGADVNIQGDTELTGSSGVTITDSTGTLTFADTDVNLSSGTSASLSISGGSSDVNFGANSSITNAQNRAVVSVEDGHTGTLTMDGTISSTAGDGIVFDNADGTYNFNGTTSLDGTTRGIDVANGSAGTFAFSEDTSIANTTNEAIRMDLANADNLDFTYSGTIQNSTGRVIDISGGPGTGQSVLFNSTAADAIQDSGQGIWIADTDADVNIQSDTELTGSSGVTITDSTGTYTFADTDINLSSGTAPPLSIDGGSSTVNFGANSSITNNQNRAVVSVENGHSGTLNMDGTITSTAGDGLVFDNADGTYNFNGTTNLNGTNRGIQIANGSSGTFTFSPNTSITDPTGVAYSETDSTANVTYNGTVTQNNNATAVHITNKTGGATTFNGLVTANTSAADAVFLNGNAGSTTSFNGGLDIDTTTGDGLYANNAGTVNITGNGNSIDTTDGRGIYLDDTTAGMTFNQITVLENSAGGDAITLREMSGSFEVIGTTSIGSAGTVGNGISITSGTTQQTGTIAFGDVNLGAAGTGGSGRAISVDGSNQTISFSNTSISGNWGAGTDVRYRGIGSAGSLWFDELNNTGTTTGRGLAIQNSAGNVTVNSGTIAGQASNALDVENGTGAVTIFADVIDLSGGGNVVSISGRSLTSQAINIMGDVTGAGGGILVDNNTGGTINFTGDITMSGERGLYVDNNSGTTVNFSGPDSVFNNRLDAVTFINNAATTSVGFNSGNLNIDSNLGSGINATGAGSLSILGNGNTIDAYNDDAIVLDGIVFRLNNTWVGNGGAFYTIDTANSTLSGSGNIAPVFNSNNGGGNAGVIEFNGGLDFAP